MTELWYAFRDVRGNCTDVAESLDPRGCVLVSVVCRGSAVVGHELCPGEYVWAY